MNRRGWLVWTWSKLGNLIIFTGMMLMLLTAYGFVSASEQADAANQLSRSLRNLILDTYDSSSDMVFEYDLPRSINGEDYSVEILDKGGHMVGIITRTKSGILDVVGGSSFATPLSNNSFGILKQSNSDLHYICIVKDDGKVYLVGSGC